MSKPAKQLKSASTRKPMLRVAYFVSRMTRQPHKRSALETRNGTLYVYGSWKSAMVHLRIRERIKRLNPGWQVGGYTPRATITPIVDAAGRPVGIA